MIKIVFMCVLTLSTAACATVDFSTSALKQIPINVEIFHMEF